MLKLKYNLLVKMAGFKTFFHLYVYIFNMYEVRSFFEKNDVGNDDEDKKVIKTSSVGKVVCNN